MDTIYTVLQGIAETDSTAMLIGVGFVIAVMVTLGYAMGDGQGRSKQATLKRRQAAYLAELAALEGQDQPTQTPSSRLGIRYRWDAYWARILTAAGVQQLDRRQAGYLALGAVGLMWAALWMFTGSPLISLIMTVFVAVIAGSMAYQWAAKTDQACDEALISFLNRMVSRMASGNISLQDAFLTLTGPDYTIGEPLAGEFHQVRSIVAGGGTLIDGFRRLAMQTKYDNVQRFSFYMVQSLSSGVNASDQFDLFVRHQLVPIRDAIKERSRLTAISRITIWVVRGGAVGVALLLAVAAADWFESFWFVHPLSYPLMAVMTAFWVIGEMINKRQDDFVESL